jgi:hypothetical protein
MDSTERTVGIPAEWVARLDSHLMATPGIFSGESLFVMRMIISFSTNKNPPG